MDSTALKYDHNDHVIMTIKIRDILYKVALVPGPLFDDLFPDCYAFIIEYDKMMVFSERYRELMTIRHEVAHAYIKACFYDYVPSGTLEGLEEICCETISHFGEQMLKNADKIKKALDLEVKKREAKNADVKRNTRKSSRKLPRLSRRFTKKK